MKRTKPLKRTAFKRKPGSLDAALEKAHGFNKAVIRFCREEEADALERAKLFQKPLKRKEPLGPGKKTKAKQAAMKAAIDGYFKNFGWEDGGLAWDQVTGLVLHRMDAIAHHKTPRSELRKAGIKDLDAPERLIVTHWALHLKWIHEGQQGRPHMTEELVKPGVAIYYSPIDAQRRFRIIEDSPVNATNGECVNWSEQDRADLNLFLGVQTHG